jgi:hypothetical protein
MKAQRRLKLDDRDTDLEEACDRLLDAAENIMRECVGAGAGDALKRRAERLLKAKFPAQPEAPLLDGMQLSRILTQLKLLGRFRLKEEEHEANRAARADVLNAMTRLSQNQAAAA